MPEDSNIHGHHYVNPEQCSWNVCYKILEATKNVSPDVCKDIFLMIYFTNVRYTDCLSLTYVADKSKT